MGLRIPQILQTMLDQPPLAVTAFHIFDLGGRQPAFCGQRIKGGKGVMLAQLWVSPAAQQLQQMRKQLQMPNAERAQLYIKTKIVWRCRQVAQPYLQIIKNRIIQVAAPDEGGNLRQKLLADSQITGDGPGPDKGCPLPCARNRFIVGNRRLCRQAQRGDGRVWPQPEIHPPAKTIFGLLAEQLAQPPGQLAEMSVLLVLCLPGRGGPGLAVLQGDQVNV